MALKRLKRKLLDNRPIFRGMHHDKLRLDLKRVAIIAEVQNQQDIDTIERFVSKKSKQGKSVSYIFYSNNKSLTHDNLIAIKEIKWTGEPRCTITRAFLENEYDILYCANRQVGLSTEYIIKATKATFKVGPFCNTIEAYLDLFVDTNQSDLGNLLTEIDTTIDKLNA